MNDNDDIPSNIPLLIKLMEAAATASIQAVAPILHMATSNCGLIGGTKVLAAAGRQMAIEGAGAVRQTIEAKEINRDDLLFFTLYIAAEEEFSETGIGAHRSCNPFYTAHIWFEKIRGSQYDRAHGPWNREDVMATVEKADAAAADNLRKMN